MHPFSAPEYPLRSGDHCCTLANQRRTAASAAPGAPYLILYKSWLFSCSSLPGFAFLDRMIVFSM